MPRPASSSIGRQRLGGGELGEDRGPERAASGRPFGVPGVSHPVLGRPPRPAEDDDPVAEHQRLVDVVGDEHDRAAGRLPGLHEQALHRGAGLGVERAERLVHADHAGLAGQGAGQLHALAHAAGELAGQPLGVPGTGRPGPATRRPRRRRSARPHPLQSPAAARRCAGPCATAAARRPGRPARGRRPAVHAARRRRRPRRAAAGSARRSRAGGSTCRSRSGRRRRGSRRASTSRSTFSTTGSPA